MYICILVLDTELKKEFIEHHTFSYINIVARHLILIHVLVD